MNDHDKLARELVAVSYQKCIECLRQFAELEAYSKMSGPEALMRAAYTLEQALEETTI